MPSGLQVMVCFTCSFNNITSEPDIISSTTLLPQELHFNLLMRVFTLLTTVCEKGAKQTNALLFCDPCLFNNFAHFISCFLRSRIFWLYLSWYVLIAEIRRYILSSWKNIWKSGWVSKYTYNARKAVNCELVRSSNKIYMNAEVAIEKLITYSSYILVHMYVYFQNCHCFIIFHIINSLN